MQRSLPGMHPDIVDALAQGPVYPNPQLFGATPMAQGWTGRLVVAGAEPTVGIIRPGSELVPRLETEGMTATREELCPETGQLLRLRSDLRGICAPERRWGSEMSSCTFPSLRSVRDPSRRMFDHAAMGASLLVGRCRDVRSRM
jgi:hypothetical protein